MSRILGLATAEPAHRYTTEEIAAAADRLWLSAKDARVRALGLKVLRAAEIEARWSVAPLETVFSRLGLGDRNDLYVEAMKQLSKQALLKACERADLPPARLDVLITTSCTGFMIPSVCAYLADELGLRGDLLRLPVTEMGCAGGTSALMYAHAMLKGNPKLKVAAVAAEAPSLTFQEGDVSPENLVSTAIFADGAACALLGGEKTREGSAPVILDASMYHFPRSTHLMGYRLTDSGLKIVLDRGVPAAIEEHFPRFFFPLLERNGLGIRDLRHLVFHPGGKKILQSVERLLAPHGKNVESAREVLRTRGNLSSATVLHVLERVLEKDAPAPGDLGYMLAFGPGFSAQSLLLRWEE